MTRIVSITPRFRRSVRIDTDYALPTALEGFHCPASLQAAVKFMATHIAETGQCAFTWTGPYGGGKSSLALALACLFGAPKPLREKAEAAFGNNLIQALTDALPNFPTGWDVMPIVTERRSIADQLIEHLGLPKDTTPSEVISELEERTVHNGLLLIMDELGRGLEAAADGEGDVHLLQDIAEIAARSSGKLIFIGILHQSFEDYAKRLGRSIKDSWAKIQGRFVDISILISLEETVDLIGEALGSKRAVSKAIPLAEECVCVLRPARSKSEAKRVVRRLARTFPLHPLTACLIGPLSRRRFGQNQRSVFSFLNSAEPYGLQDALSNKILSPFYPPCLLWNYLSANFESAIESSPDGHRWTLASDVLERSRARNSSNIEQEILKTMAILDLLKDRSGLVADQETLVLAMRHAADRSVVETALINLEIQSEIVFRKHSGIYALYAGSDFDIEEKLTEVLKETKEVDLNIVRVIADLQPMLAKRHYEETGSMRWFEMSIEPVSELDNLSPPNNAQDVIGRIIFPLPIEGEKEEDAFKSYNNIGKLHENYPALIGHHSESTRLLELAIELQGLNSLESKFAELSGDNIARREIDARIAEIRKNIEELLNGLISKCTWFQAGLEPKKLTKRQLNDRLSTIAGELFAEVPRIRNELLNCSTPSSSAVSARTKLMKRMTSHADERNLGFDEQKYPAERGLYITLLKETGIHNEGIYQEPSDQSGLLSLWQSADRLLDGSEFGVVTADKIIQNWNQSPIGLKSGLGPVFIIAYAFSRRDQVAVYQEGVFQSGFSELCVEFLARDPRDIGLRRVEMRGRIGDTLNALGKLLKLSDNSNPLVVAREIIREFDSLMPWTARTQTLSPKTMQVREILKRASDPNKLLFDDLPSLTEPLPNGSFDAKATAILLRDALSELRAAYPRIIDDLKNLMLKELDVRGHGEVELQDLRDRADNISQIGGDFRLDAFVGRLTQFHGTREDMESIASIASGKLPRDWNDNDRERASVELANLASAFLKMETLAHVKGREDRRHAFAVIVRNGGMPKSLFKEFEVSDDDKECAARLANTLNHTLSSNDNHSREIILAALAEVATKYLHGGEDHLVGERG